MLPERAMQTIRAFQESRVLLTALELDLFTAVGEGATAARVAAALETDPRATEMLLNARASMGMLSKSEGVFQNLEEAARFLVKGSPEDQRSALLHQANLWHRWSNLTECVRLGTALETRPMERRGADWTEPFIAAMHANAGARAPELVAAVGAARVGRMLDLGGGSGAYSIAFARANRELRSEILDLETVVPIARAHIAEAGLADRVSVRAGNMLAGSFGTGYDLVLLASICHMFGPEENRKLLGDCYPALAPGGRVAVVDFLLDPDGAGPRSAALFALNMLVGTRNGNTYSGEQYSKWLRDAGFATVRRLDVSGPSGLVIGEKSA